ncbi:MAG: DUF3800 domain-containing protein [Fusobacterium sp.]|nr:DUF3800 domain-containing protein [Fusobacterium sp.]
MVPKYDEKKVLRRLEEIQEVHETIINSEPTDKFNILSLLAYMLWQYPNTRNSDITLALEFYKKFYPEIVKESLIKFEDFFKIPKMYDIQRARAKIQNTEGLFPAKESVIQKRIKKEQEYRLYFKNENTEPLTNPSDYYIYFDESGKTDKYFILAGILINSEISNKYFSDKLNIIKTRLNKKYNQNIKELKFTSIDKKNINFHKEFITNLFEEDVLPTFVSIIIENKGLKQSSQKKKTENLLRIILLDSITSVIVRTTCCSSFGNTKASLNIILDKDGAGYDTLELENFKQDLISSINKQFKYFVSLDSFGYNDSKENILIQLADLYASSLNNIFSDIPETSENAKCKKQFAQLLIELIGLKSLEDKKAPKKNKVRFLNKFVSHNMY